MSFRGSRGGAADGEVKAGVGDGAHSVQGAGGKEESGGGEREAGMGAKRRRY